MTANAGGAPTSAPDVSAESSPATAPASAPQTVTVKAHVRQRMTERLKQSRKVEAEAPAATDDATTGSQGSAAEKQPGESTAPQAGKDSEEEPKGNEEQETIPLAAFKERLGRANAKAEKLQGRVQELELQAKSSTEAVRLLNAEIERYREALHAKQLLDPRDEQIRELQLQQEAQQIKAKLQQEYQEAVAAAQREAQEAAAKEAEEQQVNALRAQLQADVQAALTEFPLARRAEVIYALRQSPLADPREIAKALHEEQLTTAQRLIAPPAPKPVAPQTVSSPSPGPTRRLPATAKNMAARLAELRANRS